MSEADLLATCRAGPDLFPALDQALDHLIGHKLFTLMAIDWPRGEAARIYTNMPDDYPVGGRKPLGALTEWGKIVLEDRQPWIAYSSEDIEGAFFDHELIAQLGCASCLNVPVIDTAATGGARVIGTVNMLHEAGHYNEQHAARTAPFAELLVQPYRDWAFASR
ncbi:GAF domain-containing protein [Gymnodinialimonas sp. 2305UL16-5]|uniref:GAF domain-containing protein n=1 Tax=Gymnodinialimonas mytili TaxID=3126503 RepID=UPI00309BCDED